MRISVKRAGLFLLALAAGICGSSAPSGATGAGAYIWSGYYRDDASPAGLGASVQFVLDQGFATVRVTASTVTVGDLHLGTACAATPQLACILGKQLASDAFRDPRLKTLILTVADSTAAGHYTDPAWGAAHQTAIQAEYLAALQFLEQRLSGLSLDVVVSNWEGDNMVYCGSVYGYATSPAFRTACPGITARLDGFMAWSELRRAVVEAYVPASPGLHFHYATEFNNLRMLNQECRGVCDPALDVLHRLAALPAKPVLCSYSAWDSVKRGTLDSDLDLIRNVCATVIIGELGFPVTGTDNTAAVQGLASAGAAIAKNSGWIPATVLWNGFEGKDTVDKGFGLWTAAGSPRNLTALPTALRP